MRLLLIAIPCVLAGTVGLSSGAATAAQTSSGSRRSKSLFEQANVHFNLQEYDQALELYSEAYRARPLPGFLFNIGQCYYNLGDYEEALIHYRRYLEARPDAPNRADVERLMAAARVLQRAEDDEPGAAAALGEAPFGAPQTQPAVAPPPRQREAPATPVTRKVLLWSGVGLTVALLTAGTVTRVLAFKKSDEYNDPATPIERREELRDSGEALTAASTATLALGAATAVATALYYWLGYRRGIDTTVAATVAPNLGGASLLLSRSF